MYEAGHKAEKMQVMISNYASRQEINTYIIPEKKENSWILTKS